MVLIASAAILYVLYVHYYSEEDLTLEGISPRLARALGPQIAHHFNVLLNPRLAIEGCVDLHRLQLERDPNNGTEEGDEEIFSDFQSASSSSRNSAGISRGRGRGVRRRVVEFMGWNDENYRLYEEEEEEENTGLLTGVHSSYSRSSSSSSSTTTTTTLVQRGRFRRRTTPANDDPAQEEEATSNTELADPAKSSTKFVGIKTWAKYVKQRYQEEVQNEKDNFTKEWRRFRNSYRTDWPVQEEEEKEKEGDERRSSDVSVCPTATELKTFTNASDKREDKIDVDGESDAEENKDDGHSDDDSYDLSYPTASTEEETTSNDSSNSSKRDDLDVDFPIERRSSMDTTDQEELEDVDLQNNNDATTSAAKERQQQQQQQQNSPSKNEKEKHLELLKQTLETLEQSRRTAILAHGPNDIKVATISRKAGLLSIKFGQVDRGMLLLREYVRIRTKNLGYEFDLELAAVLYTLGDYYCQNVTNDLGNGKFELKVEKEQEKQVKQKEALGKAKRCWTGALKIYKGVGLEDNHARVCNLRYKIERVEKARREIYNNNQKSSMQGARERMAKFRSWVGNSYSTTALADEKMMKKGEGSGYVRKGSVRHIGNTCRSEASRSMPANDLQRHSSMSREEDLNWC